MSVIEDVKSSTAVEAVKNAHPLEQVARQSKKLNKFVPLAVSRNVARTVLKTKKHSPTILFVSGAVGVVATVVVASKATLNLEDAISKERFQITQAKLSVADDNIEYDAKDYKHDISVLYMRAAVKVIKLYTPAFVIGSLSLAALTGAHNIQNNRIAGLTAAYAAVERAQKEYRERVVERYGEDVDRELNYATETRTVVEEDEKGQIKKKKESRIDTSKTPAGFARIYGPDNVNFSVSPEVNLNFIRAQQNWANDMLHSKGHLVLNDVYDLFGFPRTKEGYTVGWLVPSKGGTDGYVDFGVFQKENYDRLHNFVTGRENGILLDFNHDGTIYDKI